MNQSELASPPWGSLPVEQFLLRKWDSTSTLSTDEQREQLVQAFMQEDDISAFDSTTLGDINSADTQRFIETVLVPWRPQKLHRIAEKYHPRNYPYETLVLFRTYYGGGAEDDEKFRDWVDEVTKSFEDSNPIGELFGEADDRHWRILNDASLFGMCSEDWQKVYSVLPELGTPNFRRTFNDEDIEAAKEVVPAVVDSRDPEEDDYEDAISSVAVSGCWLLIFDEETFRDDEILLVFIDKKGNVVRQSSMDSRDVLNLPHYIMRGSITESGFWQEAEVGKKYKTRGKIMRQILPLVMAESE